MSQADSLRLWRQPPLHPAYCTNRTALIWKIESSSFSMVDSLHSILPLDPDHNPSLILNRMDP